MRYVDTSFWIALFRSREKHHLQAASIWESNREPMLSTVGVLGETWTFLRRRESHAAALAVVDAIQSSDLITVIETDAAVHAAAWKWLRRRDEHECSFVDAVSFEVMRRRRLREAMAFDDDFTRAGYQEVR
jgi:predicted nucleic acid-binding protein